MSRADRRCLDELLRRIRCRGVAGSIELKTVAGAASVVAVQGAPEAPDLVGRARARRTPGWPGVPPAKVAHFAGEARVTDAADLRKYAPDEAGGAGGRAWSMSRGSAPGTRSPPCSASGWRPSTSGPGSGSSELREADPGRVRTAAGRLRRGAGRGPGGPGRLARRAGTRDGRCHRAGVRSGRAGWCWARWGDAGGVAALSAAHETVTAHHGNNYLPFVEQFYRSLALGAVRRARRAGAAAGQRRPRACWTRCGSCAPTAGGAGEYIPAHQDGKEIDLSFASEAWRKIVTDRRRPGRLVRRHFEACVFSYLAAELRSGDIAVAGSESYANFTDQLLSWEECEPLIGALLRRGGAARRRGRGDRGAAGAAGAHRGRAVDAGYPDNTDLVIDGRPAGAQAPPGQGTPRRRRWPWRRRCWTGCPSAASWTS